MSFSNPPEGVDDHIAETASEREDINIVAIPCDFRHAFVLMGKHIDHSCDDHNRGSEDAERVAMMAFMGVVADYCDRRFGGADGFQQLCNIAWNYARIHAANMREELVEEAADDNGSLNSSH